MARPEFESEDVRARSASRRDALVDNAREHDYRNAIAQRESKFVRVAERQWDRRFDAESARAQIQNCNG